MQNTTLAGWGIALVVIGAILRWAVSDSLPGISLSIVGIILILAGAVIFALAFVPRRRDTRATRRTQTPEGTTTYQRDDLR